MPTYLWLHTKRFLLNDLTFYFERSIIKMPNYLNIVTYRTRLFAKKRACYAFLLLRTIEFDKNANSFRTYK